jgi:hypothetical protein
MSEPFYIVRLDVDQDPMLNEAFVIFGGAEAAEAEARTRARGLLRPRGTSVVWSYYGPYDLPDDRVSGSCNVGVV